VRSHVDEGVEALGAKPEIEGNIAMARGTRQVVVIAVPRHDLAAFGLQRDQHMSTTDGGKVDGAIAHHGIAGRIAPGLRKVLPQRIGKRLQGRQILCHRPAQRFTQRLGQGLARADAVALGTKGLQQALGRGQRIKADSMGQLMRATRIGGQDHRQLSVCCRSGGKAVPVPDAPDHGGDATRIGPVGKT